MKLGFQSRNNLRLTCRELYNEYNDEDIWKEALVLCFGEEWMTLLRNTFYKVHLLTSKGELRIVSTYKLNGNFDSDIYNPN